MPARNVNLLLTLVFWGPLLCSVFNCRCYQTPPTCHIGTRNAQIITAVIQAKRRKLEVGLAEATRLPEARAAAVVQGQLQVLEMLGYRSQVG